MPNDSTIWKDLEIHFHSSLGYNGIYVTVSSSYFATDEDKKAFKSHLKSERDVVQIKFI